MADCSFPQEKNNEEDTSPGSAGFQLQIHTHDCLIVRPHVSDTIHWRTRHHKQFSVLSIQNKHTEKVWAGVVAGARGGGGMLIQAPLWHWYAQQEWQNISQAHMHAGGRARTAAQRSHLLAAVAEVLRRQMLRRYDSSLWILQPRLCSWLLHYGICLISLARVICCTRGGR